MAVSIKSMSQKMQDVILDKSMYLGILADKDSEDGLYCYNHFGYYNDVIYEDIAKKEKRKITLKEMMVCTYSDKRAKKDRFDRYRALDKANNVILNNQKSSLSSTKSFKKYIQKHTKEDNCKEFDMGMDWEKIAHQQRYDGLYAITTSSLELDPIEIIENYHNLYRIEDSFKVLKSTFNTRPIFHYKEERIEAHFIICFMLLC